MEAKSTYLVTCPHCGAVKRIAFSKIPWSKVDSILWSDGRIESPEWCEPARTQQCPSCNHFFVLPRKSSLQVEEVPCEDTGALSYMALKQAIAELAGSEAAEAGARLEAWQAYNALYKDVPEDKIPIDERTYNHVNMQWLLDYSIKQAPSPYSVVFELLRLLGNTKEYKSLLDALTFERYVEWRSARNRKEGIASSLDEDLLKRLYESFITEKKDALKKPQKPYKK